MRWGVGLVVALSAACSSRSVETSVKGPESLENRDNGAMADGEAAKAIATDAVGAVVTRRIPERIDWVGIGATTGPSMNQLSIEDELLAVEQRFGGNHGLLYFAGGPGSRGVQVAGRSADGDTLLLTLGELFGAATDRRTHYRSLRLEPHGPATRDAIHDGLAHALSPSSRPLLVWLAGHGGEVEELADAEVGTWGGGVWSRADLESLLSASRRPVRLIGTQCYGAGFAEALLSREDSCGAFAAVWTLPASGCDPSPDAARTSYGPFLLRAIESARDLDGDGRVGLSEAHVAAVLQVDGIDVPILSSQHLLYTKIEEEPELSPSPDGDGLFEEAALLDEVEARLGVKPFELSAAITAAQEAYEDAGRQDDEVAERELEASASARASVLSRWPELEDPWHPDFAPTLERDREAIARHLRTDPVFEAWLVATEARANSLDYFSQCERHLRALVRFEVALGTMRRAALARERMPSLYERFLRLRACEREPLPSRTP
jgi:hypothetical protein